MKSRNEISKTAQLDFNLKDLPSRNEKGEFIAASGQNLILHDHLELRNLDSEIEALTEERFSLLQEIVELGSVHSTLNSGNNSEIEKKNHELNELETEIKLKENDLSLAKKSFEKRGILIPNLSTQAEIETPPKKSKFNLGKLLKQVLFFLAIEGFLIIIQYGSLRDHLSLLEVVYRSISVLAIAILIVHVHKKSVGNFKRLNIFFIIFCLLMFVVSIILPPFLYEGAETAALGLAEDPFDLTGESGLVAETSSFWLIEKYLENTWIPAFLCVVFFLYLSYAHSLFKRRSEKEASKIILDPNDEFVQLRLIQLKIDELQSTKNNLLEEISSIETQPTEMGLILAHLEALMAKSQECEKHLKALRVQFKNLLSTVKKQLHVYKIEFMDFMMGENKLIAQALPVPCWPNDQDIINYYKTYNL